MSLNFIKVWINDKWYNKRVLIWRFTLVLIKINYGQINKNTRSRVRCIRSMYRPFWPLILEQTVILSAMSNYFLSYTQIIGPWPMTDAKRKPWDISRIGLRELIQYNIIGPYNYPKTPKNTPKYPKATQKHQKTMKLRIKI